MTGGRILVVDDEQGVRSSLSAILRDEGFEVETAESGEECLSLLMERSFRAILLDVWLPGRDGLDTLRAVRRMGIDAVVIMISGHGTIETAVRATKLGAHDFVEKPLSLDKILLTLRNALRARKLEERNRLLREELRRNTELIGQSAAVERLRATIAAAGPTGGAVLITGENGAGKELAARLIQASSPRADEAFVDVACAAIAVERQLVELFGRAGKDSVKGKLELAQEGTLFLDDVDALAPETQQLLVRALENGQFFPLEGNAALPVDVRPIAAADRDLSREIAEGRFREDLFSKLNVVPLSVPPLRERLEDIPLLVQHFLHRYAREYGRPAKSVAPAAMEAMVTYRWPGNVRELRNVVERLVILSPGETISAADLPPALSGGDPGSPSQEEPAGPTAGRAPHGSLHDARAELEQRMIRQRLEEEAWNVTRTAKSLGIERSNLYRKMKAYGIGGRQGRRQTVRQD